ncbi:TetR family transcriptional regulator [Pseudomonas sp. ATCC 13867]|uniref:TetR/AcrR family transcriptional regulator n=1 Tax=Pseudomonas sp. ATCC 13867 TaxID=1294143 RepID=UPI0002C4F17E|nr:TetR/AcrR family transcriptional regulator [Pseudomonas sp. ATCC 13867]AGI24115.1 TetR family transcriptional regulator [Pseudomonas sp. ATCC 13867]RFQ40989.1 TetR/AcrR family transcriptional regulator [Pseudomonas sp. ATCC 13867]
MNPTSTTTNKRSRYTGPTLSIRDRNRQRILLAAGEEFADKGFSAARTQDIASRAEVPKSNVYYYFQSKENLYLRLLENVVGAVLEASALLRECDDPAWALPAHIRARLHIARQWPQAYKVFASEMLHGAPHLPREWLQRLRAESLRSLECLAAWIDRGLLAPVDPQHLLLSISAATRTYVDFDWQIAMITGKAQPDASDFEAVAATITRLVLRGTEPEPATRLRPLPL